MSRQLDNDNPTIFAPTAPATSARKKSGKALLWESRADDLLAFDDVEEDESEGSEGEKSEEVDLGRGGREEIDAEEVFGELLRLPHTVRLIQSS